jgi:hypothetical protein
MSLSQRFAIFLWLALALQSGAQTAGAAEDAKENSPNRLTVSLALSADRGRDRYGNLAVQRGRWLVQNVTGPALTASMP